MLNRCGEKLSGNAFLILDGKTAVRVRNVRGKRRISMIPALSTDFRTAYQALRTRASGKKCQEVGVEKLGVLEQND